MRSKEEILGKVYGGGFDVESGWMFDGSVSEVFSAMDEYAKEVALSFSAWCVRGGWKFAVGKLNVTADELFNQFLQEIHSPIKTSHQ